LAILQAQLVARLGGTKKEEKEKIASKYKYKFQPKVVDFVTVCKLYIRIKIRKEIVKEQVN